MEAHGFQPYGRVSSRRDLRKGSRWDFRVAVLMVFPVVCLVVVLYEFLYLQEYAASGTAVDTPVNGRSVRLRIDQEMDVIGDSEPPNLSLIVRGRKTLILIANYRDSVRCAETLRSIFDNAVAPDHLKISIYDQIYRTEQEQPCGETFCQLVGEEACRRSQIVSSEIDAADATGPTAARYETEKAVADEDFCLAIDSHLLFALKWDEKIIAQWDSIANPNAIISVYPKSVEAMQQDPNEWLQVMCLSRIETDDPDSMVQYMSPSWVNKSDTPKPRLMSQLAGGFNFGGCRQIKEVRNDPYTPFLFHGEEYSRAARLWTSGYDFYVPSEDIVYHYYEKRMVVWERDWSVRYPIQQVSKRRVRYNLKLPVTEEDFDRTDLEKYTLGTKRTFEQWKNFSGIDPLAKFVSSGAAQFDNCRELEYVSY